MVAEATSCCSPVPVAEVEKADLLALAAVAAIGKTDSIVEQDARVLELLVELLVELEDETLEPLAA